MKKKVLSLLLCLAMCLSLLPTAAFAEGTPIAELRITGPASVQAGALPAITAGVVNDEYAYVEHNSNTRWQKQEDGAWHNADSAAVNDGSTHYAMRLCVDTKDNYTITTATKVYYNGTEVPGAIDSSSIYSWGAYVMIDLGLATGGTPSVPVTGVTLNKSSFFLKAGASETLTAAVEPANASDKTVTWASDKPAVATVDSTGKVTAVSTGEARITATTQDGSKTAFCFVRVYSGYNVWVGDREITPSNKSDVFGDGKVSYDPDTCTLTLNNLTSVTGYHRVGNVCPRIFSGSSDLKLNLVGSTVLYEPDTSYYSCGVWVYDTSHTLTIGGTGSLQIPFTKSQSIGIYASNLVIDSGKVYSRANTGVDTYQLTLNGGTLESESISSGRRALSYITRSDALHLADGVKIYKVTGEEKAEITAGSLISNNYSHVILAAAPVETYPVWVGNVQVTSANKGDILGDGKVSYDPAAMKLTVLDASKITTPYSFGTYSNALIYAALKNSTDTLTVAAPAGEDGLKLNGGAYCIFMTEGGLKIEGNVTTSSSSSDIYVRRNIEITGNLTSDTQKESVHSSGGTVTIHGNATTKCNDGEYTEYAIYGIKGVEIGKVAAVSGNMRNGIYAYTEPNSEIRLGTELSDSEALTATHTISARDSAISAQGGSTTKISIKGNLVAGTSNSSAIYASGKLEMLGGAYTWDLTGDTSYSDAAFRAKEISLDEDCAVVEPAGGEIKQLSSYSNCYYPVDSTGAKVGHMKIAPVEKFTVQFETYGGAPVPETQHVAAGEKAVKPADPSKGAELVFGGWFTSSAFDTEFDFDTPINANTCIYAKWKTVGKTQLDGTALENGKFYTVAADGTVAVGTPLDTAPASGKYIKYTENGDAGVIEAFGGDVTVKSATDSALLKTGLSALTVKNDSGALTLTVNGLLNPTVFSDDAALTLAARTSLAVNCINVDGPASISAKKLTMTAAEGDVFLNGFIYASSFDIKAKGDVDVEGYFVSTVEGTGKIVSETGNVSITGEYYCLYSNLNLDFTVNAAKKINIRSTETSAGATRSILSARNVTLIAPEGVTVYSADKTGPYVSGGKLTMTASNGPVSLNGFIYASSFDIKAKGDVDAEGYFVSTVDGTGKIVSETGDVSITGDYYCFYSNLGLDLTVKAGKKINLQSAKKSSAESYGILSAKNATLIAPDGITVDSADKAGPYVSGGKLTMTASNGPISLHGYTYADSFDIEAKGDVDAEGYFVSTVGGAGKIVSETGDVSITGDYYCFYSNLNLDLTVKAGKKINLQSTKKSSAESYSILSAKNATLIAPDGITVDSADKAGPYASGGKLTVTASNGPIFVNGCFVVADCEISAMDDIDLYGYLWLSNADGAFKATSQKGDISVTAESAYCFDQLGAAEGLVLSAKKINLTAKSDTGAAVRGSAKLTADEITVQNTGSGKAFAEAPDLSAIERYTVSVGDEAPGTELEAPEASDYTENAYVHILRDTSTPPVDPDEPETTYRITVKSDRNGEVTANAKNAAKGDKVTLTVKPAKGYELETLTVTAKNGKELKLTEKNGKYVFTMPASAVTVKATFREDNSMLNFFTDVPADAYYYDAVLWAAENGITGGVDAIHFAPDGTCTRAQAVTFLWRAAGCPAPKSDVMPFADVKAGSYYYDAVLWAVENGITNGTSDTAFSPEMVCSRAQIVTLLWRAQHCPAAGTVNPFTDVKADAYYADAVLWAVKENITKGTSASAFSPDMVCSRAQIVTFIWRALAK